MCYGRETEYQQQVQSIESINRVNQSRSVPPRNLEKDVEQGDDDESDCTSVEQLCYYDSDDRALYSHHSGGIEVDGVLDQLSPPPSTRFLFQKNPGRRSSRSRHVHSWRERACIGVCAIQVYIFLTSVPI